MDNVKVDQTASGAWRYDIFGQHGTHGFRPTKKDAEQAGREDARLIRLMFS